MIDLNLPEPEEKECAGCHRKDGNLKGYLIHWPSQDCKLPVVETISGVKVEPFSMWLYQCRWCRGAMTRLRNKGKEAPCPVEEFHR